MTVNAIELATNLAYNAAKDEMFREELITNEEEMVVEDQDNNCLIYTEQAQEVFNRWYDYYYDEIEKVKQNK